MANVKEWSYSIVDIYFGKKQKFDMSGLEALDKMKNTIKVDSAIMDADVQCFHCGKNIKAGKLVFCSARFYKWPSGLGDQYWGDSHKPTFCSNSHDKLFAKNTY
jgi:hypothetical protein